MLINEGDFLDFVAGDTAWGVAIEEPTWDLTGATAVVHVEGLTSRARLAPFDGQAAEVAPEGYPHRLQYAWPSPPPAGKWRVWFTVTFAGGGVSSTEAVGVLVETA